MTTDYLLVDRAIKKELLASIEATIKEFYGDAPSKSPDYGRIINAHHFARLSRLLKEGEIVIGGETNPADLYIAPTVIDNVSPEHATMKEEIFGPILPVLEYEKLDDAISFVNERPKPLALFFFSRDKTKQEKVLRECRRAEVASMKPLYTRLTSASPSEALEQAVSASTTANSATTHFQTKKAS
jgi:acyl-CoA reductase-like NAD-dependent aldehyde dehydrogenase